jgi:hypothetical protein
MSQVSECGGELVQLWCECVLLLVLLCCFSSSFVVLSLQPLHSRYPLPLI